MNSPAGQNPPHILILDDDTAHQELCLRAFRDDPGRFRISVAGTLKEARQVIEQDPPDLIIADWILPEGKGLDILPRSEGKVTIPLIVMTSYGDEHLAVEIMKSGAIDYVVKSATVFRDLPRIVHRALRDWENIQDRKRAESVAQDAQKRLADILAFLPDATFAIDHDGRVIAWNRAIERMTGVSAADMLGKGEYEYSLPFYGERRPILIDLVLMDDAEIEKKYDYIQREDGRITSETFIPGLFGGKGAYLFGTASPLSDAAGNRTGAIEVIRDITDRKRIALALEKSEDRFRHISGLTSDFAYSCTRPRDGCLTIDWITGASQKITGYPEEEILKMGCWRGIVAEEDLFVFDEKIAGLLPGNTSQCELRILTKDGATTWLRCFAECIIDPDNPTTSRLFGGCKDITGRKNADEALLESERNLTRAQEIGHLGNWNWDIAGNRLVWSDEIYRIFGVPRNFTLTYDAIAARIHPDDRERMNRTVKDFLADGNTVESEFRMIRPDGKERWLYQKMEMAKDPSGSPVRAFGIIQDITDRKVVEQALVESEKKYRFLVDNVRDVVWQTKPDLTFTYVSPSVESRTGYSPAELAGTSLLHLLTESSARYVRERLKKRMEDYSHGSRDLATVFEIELTRKGGGTCWFEVSSNAVFGPDESIAGFQGISRDITERKQVESALVESEARFRELFNNMGAGVAIYEPVGDDEDFIIRNVNRAVETIEKVKKEEIVGKSVREVFPGVVEFGLFDVFCRVARTGIPESHPVSMYKDDRISGWRENYVYRIPSGEIVALYEDVTEKKQAEDDRERLLAAVEEERQKLSSLVSSITDEVWFADTEHRFTLANPRAVEVFGLDPKETIRVETLAGSVTVLRPDGTPRPVEEAPPLRALNGEVVRNLEEMVITPLHGELRYRLVSAAPVRNLSGTIIGSVSVVRDITELKRAEGELRVSQAQLKEAMDLARLVNWEFDALAGIFTFNDRFYSLYGTTAEREGGYRMSAEEYALRFVYPEDRDLVADEVRKAVEATDPAFISQVEHRIVRRDNEIRTIVVRFGIILDENGRTVKTFGANQDITDRKRMEQALLESEGRYRGLMDHLPDYVIVHREGILLYVNPSGAARMGYDPETLVGKPILPLVDPAYHDTIQKAITQRMEGEDLPSYEIKIVTKDGALRTVLVNGVMIQYGGGPASLNVLTDITLQKEAEEIRKAYEIRLDSAMEIGSLAWWEMDLPDGSVRFDDRKATMLGYSPDQFHHFTDFTALLHPDDREPAMQAMRDHLAGREARYHTDYRIRAATGDYRWFRDVGGVTRHHPDGSPMTVTGIVIDITVAKEAEDAIRATETRFRALIQNASDLIRILDADGRILYESPSAERILGYPEGSLLGTDPLELVHPDDLERVRHDLQEVYGQTNSGTPTEFRIRKADGDYLWVDAVGTNLIDVPGVNGVVVTTRPIQQRKEAEEKIHQTLSLLERSEALLRKVYEILPIGLWLADKNGKLIYGNPAGVKIWGAEPHVPMEEYGIFKARRYPSGEEIAPGDWALIQTIQKGVTIRDELIEIDAFDKKKKIILNFTAPLLNALGEPDGAIIVNQEVTERIVAEEALRLSEQRLSLALEATSDGLWDWDLSNDHVYWSPRAYEMLGYAPDEFPVNFSVWNDLLHPDDREATEKTLNAQLKDGRTFSAEFRYRMKDGSWKWILGRGRAVAWDPAGNVTRMVGTHVDLTGQKEAESALRESEERLRLALEGADVASWDWDLKTGTAVFSDRFYTMLDYRPGEFPATYDGWVAHIHPDDKERVLPDLMRQIAEKRPLCEIEYRLMTKDANWLWILGRGKIAEFDENGTPSRLTGVNIDITSRRLMESEIRSLNTVLEERVRDRTEALEKTNKALEEENAQRLEAEGKLQASYDEKVMLLKEIHHRVKNNLQIIASLLNLQSRYIKDEQTLAAIRESQNRVKAMALVHEKLYKAEDISHISLADYLRFLGTGLFQFYDAKSRGIQFHLDIGDVNVDINSAIPLGLIINELISNSLKYAFPDGRKGEIAIRITKEEHTLTVLFRDTGIGIPSDLNWQNTQSLGLRLVNTLVDQMDGTIELDRSSGTQFTMVVHEKV